MPDNAKKLINNNYTSNYYMADIVLNTHTHTLNHPFLNQSSDFELLNHKSYKHFRMISFYKPQSPMTL